MANYLSRGLSNERMLGLLFERVVFESGFVIPHHGQTLFTPNRPQSDCLLKSPFSLSLSLSAMNVLNNTHTHTHANSLTHMHSISSLTQAQILTFSYLLQAYAHSLIRRISLNSTYMITSTLTHSHSLKFKLI